MKSVAAVSSFAVVALMSGVAGAQSAGASVSAGGAAPSATVQVQAQAAPPPVYAQPQPVYAQPVYAQPVYAQPVYAQPVYSPQSTVYYGVRRPMVRPYTGGPVPPGAHVESRVQIGLVAGGAALFGGAWFPTIFALAFPGSEFAAIPVVGPIIGGVQDLGTSNDALHVLGVWAIIDGLAQAGGIAMLVVGIALPHRVLVSDYAHRTPHDEAPRWAVLPGVAGHAGMAPGATLSIVNF